jgi:hypothetical protein
MDTVPLDLQRRCEQRWAARFRQPAEPAATPEHRFEKQEQQLTAGTNIDERRLANALRDE